MLIKKHDNSDLRLADLADVALTLNWLPTTDLLISEIGDEYRSHALIDTDGVAAARNRARTGPLTARGGP